METGEAKRRAAGGGVGDPGESVAFSNPNESRSIKSGLTFLPLFSPGKYSSSNEPEVEYPSTMICPTPKFAIASRAEYNNNLILVAFDGFMTCDNSPADLLIFSDKPKSDMSNIVGPRERGSRPNGTLRKREGEVVVQEGEWCCPAEGLMPFAPRG